MPHLSRKQPSSEAAWRGCREVAPTSLPQFELTARDASELAERVKVADVPIDAQAQKRLAAESAIGEVRSGMIVGIGTGTTTAFAIAALARRVSCGLAITAVATSEATAGAALAAGIQIRDLADIAAIDLCIDGIDEIDPDFRAIKGAGAAMLREKVVASAATRMIAIGDASKAVARLGARPVPVEVLPSAQAFVAARIVALGGAPSLRQGPGEAVALTDQRNVILDCQFGAAVDYAALAAALDAVPGLLGHGLFLTEIDALYLGTGEGVIRTERVADADPHGTHSSHNRILDDVPQGADS